MVGECRANVSSPGKMVGECRANVSSPTYFPKWSFWRVNGHFGEYSKSPKLANFWRVLEFDKFAGEWPLLSYFSKHKKKKKKLCINYFLNVIYLFR